MTRQYGEEQRSDTAKVIRMKWNWDNFSERLITWQKAQGRHHLPWQKTRDAYRIWLSEIMLQQTQVSTVIDYYNRFLHHFPTVEALAHASTDEVMALWAGLGYYSRARNLHRCAQYVVEHFAGQFPQDLNELQTLPGIGRSTAAAISAFAYSTRAAILDGNVKRVLTRIFGIAGYPGIKAVENQLWQLAESLLPTHDIEAYTQGLMDFGATVCKRSKPLCLPSSSTSSAQPGTCPFIEDCIAYQNQRIHELPASKPRKPMPWRAAAVLIFQHKGQILLQQRPAIGIWGGLWSLPQIDLNHLPMLSEAELTKADTWPQEIIADCLAYTKNIGTFKSYQPHPSIKHTFTHFHLRLFPLVIELAPSLTRQISDPAITSTWFNATQLKKTGMPAPIKRLLENILPAE